MKLQYLTINNSVGTMIYLIGFFCLCGLIVYCIHRERMADKRKETLQLTARYLGDKLPNPEEEAVACSDIKFPGGMIGVPPVADVPNIYVIFCKQHEGWVPYTGYNCDVDPKTTVKFINCINDAADILNENNHEVQNSKENNAGP